MKHKLYLWFIIITGTPHIYTIGLKEKIQQLDQQVMQGGSDIDIDNVRDKQEIKHIIRHMYELDQKIRKDNMGLRNNPDFQAVIKKMDSHHTDIMKKIIARYGWIRISEFGREADAQAWLLVQHADGDPLFQSACVFLLGQLIASRETIPENYAYLFDRAALKFQHIGLKQRYGTQVEEKNGNWVLRPCEGSLEEINRRRHEVGLVSVEDYLKEIRQIYG